MKTPKEVRQGKRLAMGDKEVTGQAYKKGGAAKSAPAKGKFPFPMKGKTK